MNDQVALFRMNALRLAPAILESQYLIQSERYIKNVRDNQVEKCNKTLIGDH